MKRIQGLFFIINFILFLSTTLSAQVTAIDSIQNKLMLHKEKDTLRVNLLNNIAFLSREDTDKSIQYLDEAQAIARAIDFKNGLAKSLSLRGMTLSLKTSYKDGSQYLLEALEIYKSIDDKKGIAKTYSTLSIFFFRKRDYRNSIKYDLELIKINEEIGDMKAVGRSFFFIGRGYVEIGDYDNGISYYNKAIKVSEEINDEVRTGYSFSGLGDIYSHQGNYPLALEHYNKATAISKKAESPKLVCNTLISTGNVYIRMGNYDKAIAFHEEALEIALIHNKMNLASINQSLGESYRMKKKFEKAREYFDEAIIKYQELNDKNNEAITLNCIADIYLELENYKLAYQYFDQARLINLEADNQRGLAASYYGIAKVFANQKLFDNALTNALLSKKIAIELELLDDQKWSSKLLSSIYENKGDYKKAYENHQQFKTLNDSIFNKKNIQKITQLESEYQHKQALDSASIRELKLTNTVNTTSQNLEKSQRNLLLGVIAFLFTTLVLGAIIFFLRLRNAKSETQNIIIEQKLLRSQMTPHFIFNALSVLQGMILNKEEKRSLRYLSKFSKLLRTILENSRDKTVDLSQELSAVESYLALQNLENESYDYTVIADDSVEVSSFQIPPMLIQPFVENALEHAFVNQNDNKKIDVKLSYVQNELICTITDNGIGVDLQKENKTQSKKSLATIITSERLRVVSKDFKTKGSITVEDRNKYNDRGTVVTLVIPHKINAA